MGIGKFSNDEQKVLDDKFNKLHKKIDDLLDRISKMRNAGTTILDSEGVEKCFNDVREKFEKEQKKLEDIVGEYRKAASEYTKKLSELHKREDNIRNREIEADNDFPARYEERMRVYDDFEEAIKKQWEEAISLAKKRNESYMDREKNLLKDINNMQDELYESHRKSNEELEKKLKDLATREADLVRREADVLKREIDAGKEFPNKELAIQAQWKEYYEAKEKLNADKDELENKKRANAEWEEELKEKARVADNNFANKYQESLKEIEEEQKKAEKKRTETINSAIESANEERRKRIEACEKECEQKLKDAELDCAKKRNEIREKKESLDAREKKVNEQLREIQRREFAVKNKEEEAKNLYDFWMKKLERDEKKFRKIANNQVDAAEAGVKALEESKRKISQELCSWRLKYEEQKLINDRFDGKTAEEIDATIKELEATIKELERENSRLLARCKNKEATIIRFKGKSEEDVLSELEALENENNRLQSELKALKGDK